MTRIWIPALLLGTASSLAAQQYPTEPPPAAAITPAPFPPTQEATLPNGLRLLVVEDRSLPLVSVTLAFPAGGVHDPVGKEGLASMVAGLLTKGAGTRTAEQIAETIEGAGGSLSAGAGNDFFTVSAGVLTPHLPLAFELLADVVMRPTFPEAEVALLRTQTLSGLQVELSNPAALASRALFRELYGSHPYGRAAVPASIRAISRDDLVAFHQARLRPGGALLVMAGDIDLAEARRHVMQAFRGWLGRPPAATAAVPMPGPRASEIVLVHRPGSVQSNILAGNLALTPTDALVYPGTVADRVLGGGADARLFLILREEKGWTYGAYSSLVRRKERGYFLASAEVRTEVTDSALREMLVQLRRIRTELVTPEELEAAKGSLVGSYPLSIQTADDVAGAVANMRLYGLPDDYVQTYRVRLAAVTAEQLRDAARRIMRPDSAVIIVVGDGQKVYPTLQGIAPIRIVDPEGRALTADDLTPKLALLPFEPTRLAAHRDSFDIMVQGNRFGYTTAAVSRTDDGWSYRESTRIGGFVEQDTEVLTDAGFAPRRVTQTGTVQGQATTIEILFQDGRATGSATTPDPETGAMRTVAIDTVVAAGVLDDNLIQPVLSTLPWSPEARWTFTGFSAGAGETRQMTLAVTGTESVETPAGTEECYRVELSGGPQAVTFYLTTAAPHRLMKIAIAGTPIEMLRAAP